MMGTSPFQVFHTVAGHSNKVPQREVLPLINTLVFREEKSMTIATVGFDLAKNVFAEHSVDRAGKLVQVHFSMTRNKPLELRAS